MRSLILDQSTTKAGWAVIDNGDIADRHGRITLKGKVRDRVKELLKDVREIINLFTPQEMVIEDTRYFRQKSADTNVAMNALYWELEGLAIEMGLPFYSVSPNTIKLAFTGNGAASKDDMVAMVTQRTGIIPFDDNHADAIAGALCWAVIGDEQRRKRA